MHVTLDTKALSEKLELVGRVSTKHITLPVLQCVLLEAKGGVLTLRGTNLEIGVEVTVPADVTAEGSIAVPAATLIQIVNLHTQKDIVLKAEGTTLAVEGGRSSTQIKSIPHEEFPKIPKLEGVGQMINGALFALGVKTTVFAASQSSIKPELGSVYVYQKKEHTLTFVATDSFRLMEKTVSQKGVTFDASILIPSKNAQEIARICEVKGSDPLCRVDENQFSLEFDDGVYITSRLTTGSFPDYEQIIPKEYVTHVTALKDDLVHAFKKSNIFLNKFFQVRLDIGTDVLTISADNGEVGMTTESVKVQTEGEELRLSFNQRYVSEALNHFVDDSVVMHFAGIGRPMVVTGVSDASMRYLVMPMNK